MLVYILRRLLYILLTILIVTLIVFVLVFQVGDPAINLTPVKPGMVPTKDMVDRIRKKYGLDKPVYIQYLNYLNLLAHGDMGDSYYFRRPVVEMMAEKFPITATLAGLIVLTALIIGLPMGTFAALNKNGPFDRAIIIVTTALISMPEFLIAFGLLLLFANKSALDIFPAKYDGTWRGWILPVIAVALPRSFSWAIYLRTNMLNALGDDFARTARAKGLSFVKVAMKHVLPNALIPVVALVGMEFAYLMTGIVIIETLFTIPGIGITLQRAAGQRDIPVIMASVLITSIFVGVFNMIADLMIARLDPRIRLSSD
jgi:ABC-type dipeptide/oligopeptide/nickel transport system permease component